MENHSSLIAIQLLGRSLAMDFRIVDRVFKGTTNIEILILGISIFKQ